MLGEAIAVKDLDDAHFICNRMKDILEYVRPHSNKRLGCACDDELVWLLDEAKAAKDLDMVHLFCKRVKIIVARAAQQILRNATQRKSMNAAKRARI